MRQTISGLVAAIAVVAASAVPAMACGGGLFQGPAYASPCAHDYVPAYEYSGCNAGCGGWVHERLPDPVHQYYYVNQGPTYTGPGNFAPYPTYQESAVSDWDAYRRRPYYYGNDGGRYAEGPAIYSYRARPHFRPWRARHGYGYAQGSSVRYGYAPRHGYAPRYYGQREPVLRRYY
jgi:hypothetical protein